MEDSILKSIKKMLGIHESYTEFDTDIIIHINSVFSILTQMGAGPVNGYYISDDGDEWSDFIEDRADVEMIKTYVYLKVKQMFDPPSSSSVSEASKNLINELEWRISVGYNPNR